jgi:tyrosyl-tRNA synthetase
MYGKLMSISDDLMWRYWTLLTDLRPHEIEAMKNDVASGALHPMEAKKRLARTITAGFHSETAAQQADENWAKQFQRKEMPEDVERVTLTRSVPVISIPKLLFECGLAESRTDADRKLKQGAVKINGEIWKENSWMLGDGRVELEIRVGKRAKIAVIE